MSGKISNCINYGTISNSTKAYVGGVFGAGLSGAKVDATNCSNYCEVLCTAPENSTQYGAIFGGAANTKGTITLTNCSDYSGTEQLYPVYAKDNKTKYNVVIK